MNNSKSGLVGVLSFIVLTAASLGVLGVASRSAGAAQSVSPAASGVVRDGGEPAQVTTIEEITVTPSVKHAAARKSGSVIHVSSDVCYTRAFHDGDDTSVRTCTPADMIGQ